MKRVVVSRPSPALVIACLALFVSLGGVSYGVATGFIDSREIRNNTVRTQDLRNNEVRSIDIRNETILGRDVGLDTLTGSDVDESRLAQVPDSSQLGGVGADGYVRRDAIGPLPLALQPGWSGVTGQRPASYDLDPLGYVHLSGMLERDGTGRATALVLPAGARPGAVRRFIVWREGVAQPVEIQPSGALAITGSPADDDVALDGVSFRLG